MILGVALAVSGLFGDRARGRPRCPRCWFDMSGSPSLTCGECGRTARSARDLRRTRRRPVRAIGGLLLAVGVGAAASDEIVRGNLPVFLPTSTLVTLLPVVGDHSGSLTREMNARLRAGKIDPDEAMHLLERAMAGSWLMSAPDEAWVRQYGTMAQALVTWVEQAGGPEHRAAASRLLYDTVQQAPPTVRIRAGAVMPAGAPVPAIAEVSEWWLLQGELRLDIEAMMEGAPRFRVMRTQQMQPTHGFTMTLPAMAAGTHEITFDVRCQRRAGANDAWADGPAQRVTARFVITNDAPQREVRRDPELDDAIRTVFSGGLAHYQDGTLPVRIAIDRRPTFTDTFDGVAIGVEVDVLRNGSVVRRLTSWWLAGAVAPARQVLWEVPWFDDDALAPEPSDEEVWELRVRSRADLAAQIDGAHSVWVGEVTVPAVVRRIERRAPPTVWLPWGSDDD